MIYMVNTWENYDLYHERMWKTMGQLWFIWEHLGKHFDLYEEPCMIYLETTEHILGIYIYIDMKNGTEVTNQPYDVCVCLKFVSIPPTSRFRGEKKHMNVWEFEVPDNFTTAYHAHINCHVTDRWFYCTYVDTCFPCFWSPLKGYFWTSHQPPEDHLNSDFCLFSLFVFCRVGWVSSGLLPFWRLQPRKKPAYFGRIWTKLK